MIRHKSLRPSLSANIAENQQVTNLHPDLHPLLVNLGVILHPLFGAPLIDDMLKVLKFWCILIFQLVTSIFGIFEANSTSSKHSNTPYRKYHKVSSFACRKRTWMGFVSLSFGHKEARQLTSNFQSMP